MTGAVLSSGEAVSPEFPPADFYDCHQAERLTHKTPGAAVEVWLEGWMTVYGLGGTRTVDGDLDAIIRERAPVTVTAYRRAEVSDAWVSEVANGLLQKAAEDFALVLGDPEGSSDDGLNNAAFQNALPEMIAVVRKFYAHADVWACQPVGLTVLDAEQVAALMRAERPDWFEKETR